MAAIEKEDARPEVDSILVPPGKVPIQALVEERVDVPVAYGGLVG
jgi:hypothetical protein